MHYLGVDVSCDTFEVCQADEVTSFPNNREGIRVFMNGLGEDVQVVLEPTSTYHHALVEAMRERGIVYTLVNPKSSAAYGHVLNTRAKTDKVDARLLAKLGQTHQLAPSSPINHSQEQLKALKRHLGWLEREAQAARNRLSAALRSPWTPKAVTKSLKQAIKQLEQHVLKAQHAIDDHLKEHPDLDSQVALLTSIPGVGRKTAVLVLSEMPAVANCTSSKSWVAFSGLNPEPRQSGKSSSSRLSRIGAARVRAGLYLAAVTAMRFNPLVRALEERLKARGKPGKVRVVAAMNKLLRLCYGVLRSGRPFDLSMHQQA